VSLQRFCGGARFPGNGGNLDARYLEPGVRLGLSYANSTGENGDSVAGMSVTSFIILLLLHATTFLYLVVWEGRPSQTFLRNLGFKIWLYSRIAGRKCWPSKQSPSQGRLTEASLRACPDEASLLAAGRSDPVWQ
jgi:hypothetical protein